MLTQTDDQVGKTNPSNMTLLKEPEYNQDLKSINSGKNHGEGQTLVVVSDKSMISRELSIPPIGKDNHLPKEIVVSSTKKANLSSSDINITRSKTNFSPGIYQSVLQDFKKPWRHQPKDVLVSYYKSKKQTPLHHLALSDIH